MNTHSQLPPLLTILLLPPCWRFSQPLFPVDDNIPDFLTDVFVVVVFNKQIFLKQFNLFNTSRNAHKIWLKRKAQVKHKRSNVL